MPAGVSYLHKCRPEKGKEKDRDTEIEREKVVGEGGQMSSVVSSVHGNTSYGHTARAHTHVNDPTGTSLPLNDMPESSSF